MEITKQEYEQAKKIVWRYELQEKALRKKKFNDMYKGKTESDIVIKTTNADPHRKQIFHYLYLVDLKCEVMYIREHTLISNFYTIDNGKRKYDTYELAFAECVKRLRKKGYIE